LIAERIGHSPAAPDARRRWQIRDVKVADLVEIEEERDCLTINSISAFALTGERLFIYSVTAIIASPIKI
jgi:hypothetical protein